MSRAMWQLRTLQSHGLGRVMAQAKFNPRHAIRTQQQRQFPGVGQVVVEETPDRLQDRYLLLGDSVGG